MPKDVAEISSFAGKTMGTPLTHAHAMSISLALCFKHDQISGGLPTADG